MRKPRMATRTRGLIAKPDLSRSPRSRSGLLPALDARALLQPLRFFQEPVADARHDFRAEEIGRLAREPVAPLGPRAIQARGAYCRIFHGLAPPG